MKENPFTRDALTVMQRCDLLSTYSEETGHITRSYASPPMLQVNLLVMQWMRNAGMSAEQDIAGNIIGRYEGQAGATKTLLLGSHLDSVRDAGKYDGILGVLVALACIERLNERRERLSFALELLCFADEEGLRYSSAYIGSKAMTGTFESDALDLKDAHGISLRQAMEVFGGKPDLAALRTPRWHREELLGYCEVHIEQGPVLEARGLPIGVVSAIAGQRRIRLRFTGKAGHAGTVPMTLRQDALCAAAEFVLAVESYAKSVSGLVATVGQATVQPGAGNVIPGEVTLSLDVRHQNDDICLQASRELEQQGRRIGATRHIELDWQLLQVHDSVPCSERLSALLTQAVEVSGYATLALPSGAGHDAVVVSTLTDICMLFVRCRDGISHNPAESVKEDDVAVAIAVLERFLTLLSQEGDASHESL